jgi:hypothetical protein
MNKPSISEIWVVAFSDLQELGFLWVFGAIWLVLGSLIFLYPVARILRRLGISGWWALISYVPLVNVIALWILAFAEWPRDRKT